MTKTVATGAYRFCAVDGRLIRHEIVTPYFTIYLVNQP